MSTADRGQVLGTLAATVHALDPVDRVPLILTAGTEITDPAIAEQISNPDCWEGGPPTGPSPGKSSRKAAKASEDN
ncbi:hypothetical protein ACH4UT_23460 [Streptomyces sp. NPDC020799]|uniref:hypothetical protein n=1 Tax=Streptomyces sp. NPDC020799 TaxID=3365091 RepID=UPI00347BC2D6